MFTFNEAYAVKLLNNDHNKKALYGIIHTLAPWSYNGGWLPQTDATEHIGGSSGRGAFYYVAQLQHLAATGILESYKKGRATYYRAPNRIYELAKKHRDFHQETFNLEIQFINDGDRPCPRLGI